MAMATAPSVAQIRWLKNLGLSDTQIDGMDRRSAAAYIEEHKDGGGGQQSSSPATERLSPGEPAHRMWDQMRAFFDHWDASAIHTRTEAATLAVEFFDVRVEHPDCWPSEIHQALDGVDLDGLRVSLADAI